MGVIEIQELTKLYPGEAGVHGLSLSIDPGDAFGFIGPNGAGKTTTIRIMATLLEPTSGSVLVDGYSVVEAPEKVREVLGYMPDYFGVYDGMRVWEYLDFFAAAYRKPKKDRAGIVSDVLELTDMTPKRDVFIEHLSTGLKQRLCLAKTLIHDPKVLVLDEPASGLDPRARVELKELLRELTRMGKTIFVSSHILPELADFCNKVGILQAGKLLLAGRVEEVVEQVRARSARLINLRTLTSPEAAAEVVKSNPMVGATRLEDGRLQFEYNGDGGPGRATGRRGLPADRILRRGDRSRRRLHEDHPGRRGMNLENPVFVREMRAGLRDRRLLLAQTSYLSTLALVAYVLLLTSLSDHDSYRPELSRTVLHTLFATQWFLVLFIAPALACGAISGEKEKRSFEMVLASRLSPGEIVAGKLGFALSYLLIMLVSSLPITALLFFLGGVSPGEVAVRYVIVFAGGALTTLLGIFFSAREGRTTSATNLTYGVTVMAGLASAFFLVTTAQDDIAAALVQTVRWHGVPIPVAGPVLVMLVWLVLVLFTKSQAFLQTTAQSVLTLHRLFAFGSLLTLVLVTVATAAQLNQRGQNNAEILAAFWENDL
ncbi:MAG: ATP-binding cassette domain-containing protein, partial [Candidatus Xenobia bacterium]